MSVTIVQYTLSWACAMNVGKLNGRLTSFADHPARKFKQISQAFESYDVWAGNGQLETQVASQYMIVKGGGNIPEFMTCSALLNYPIPILVLIIGVCRHISLYMQCHAPQGG